MGVVYSSIRDVLYRKSFIIKLMFNIVMVVFDDGDCC